jgi:hypothetical protein
MENLVEIRCPFEKTSKSDNQLYKCNRVCVKVAPGSAGEARCRSCHLSFEFEVDDQAQNTTGVRVQKQNIEK